MRYSRLSLWSHGCWCWGGFMAGAAKKGTKLEFFALRASRGKGGMILRVLEGRFGNCFFLLFVSMCGMSSPIARSSCTNISYPTQQREGARGWW